MFKFFARMLSVGSGGLRCRRTVSCHLRHEFTSLAVSILAVIFAQPVLGTVLHAESSARPNIVLILTDDHGYADLSCQNEVSDVRTPHVDSLAANGVRMTAGYVTAPQCSPSRAAVITGRYQQRFGLDEISRCPLPLEEVTLAERLKAAGYRTGMVGKWHLSPNAVSVRWAKKNLPNLRLNTNGRVNIPLGKTVEYFPHAQGFDEYYAGEVQQYFANFDPGKNELLSTGKWRSDRGYRIDLQTTAATNFIDRNADQPFFLYLCYFGPHVPLQATPEYLKRFPGEMKERRRYGLAMLSAIDDGVGQILSALRKHEIEENTLIVFTSDNGAPLKLNMEDDPIGRGGPIWDGSLNTPWIGEKGMLSEGGIRVPFILQWKNVLPADTVYEQPVSTLDIAATAIAAAGQAIDNSLDGVDLLPYLTGEKKTPPHQSLFWRFWNQSAVRSGKWKYLKAGQSEEYLFDLDSQEHERKNVLKEHPDVAADLATQLKKWSEELRPPGLPRHEVNDQESAWFKHYLQAD
ncbi:sulfatase-like hydrolase/transferase [Thalassoglobus sp.]|uniref:sulfatase-like hydrolase/transferase n=1 Tax=Thalassoglobus sp. TaxID=2795869 RepID=UPI003AA85D80